MSREPITAPIKWAGSKRKIVHELIWRMPRQYTAYYELFLGSGALFFQLRPTVPCYLNDQNPHLINMFEQVRDRPADVLERVEAYDVRFKEDRKTTYYDARSQWLELEGVDHAALFLFMIQTCFNGLFRVNKSGGFNAPIGTKKAINITGAMDIFEVSAALQECTFTTGDYESVIGNARAGDFVYLDPPYVPLTTDFKYTAEGFNLQDQSRLAAYVTWLGNRGVNVMLSNHDTPETRELYHGLHVTAIDVQRTISRDGAGRKKVSEVIVTTYPTR